MGSPDIGEVVLIPFPFSDLSSSKLRPALVLAHAGRDDWVCLQITSRPWADPFAIRLDPTDFEQGSLERVSFIRPGKMFTAHQAIFRGSAGRICIRRLAEVRSQVIDLIRNGRFPEESGA